MGIPEIIKIVVSLMVPVPVLAVALLLVRRRRWVRRIPRRLVAPLWLGCLSLISSVTMITWSQISLSPAEAAAASTTAAEGDLDDAVHMLQLGLGGQWIYLYHLENWGEVARRERIGQQITVRIRESLKDEGIPVRTGEEYRIPLDLFQREQPDANMMAHYRKVVPFTCVWGYVSTTQDGTLEVHISVSAADANVRPKRLYSKKFSFGASPDAVARGVKKINEEVMAAIREEL